MKGYAAPLKNEVPSLDVVPYFEGRTDLEPLSLEQMTRLQQELPEKQNKAK